MLQHWLLITFSWLGAVRLQYINTGGPGADIFLDPVESAFQYPPPYVQYLNIPTTRSDYEPLNDDSLAEQFYPREDVLNDQSRSRRKADENEEVTEKRALTNIVDKDKTVYIRNDNSIPTAFLDEYSRANDENSTDLFEPKDKKYFSPWGGKRDKISTDHMWTWKRGSNIKEPSMPKRVRFSPWGGKRSGQMIYKGGDSKGSKIIFSTTIPELTRILTNSLAGGKINFAGYQLIHSLDKRHPIKILTLSTRMDDKTLRETMPFKTFLESLPKIFKPGHPYLDVNLKKDGKRKVKFSAWGGKRSPPIIGPIWTPEPQDIKDSTLDTILLIRNSHENKDQTVKAI